MDKDTMKQELINAWKETLNVDDVNDDSDFFEDGGDSISGLNLAAAMAEKKIKLDITDLFDLAKLGKIVDKLTILED